MIRLRTLQLIKRHFHSFFRHNTPTKFVNLVHIYDQFWRGSPIVQGYPFEIIIDPINFCNLRCPLCVTGQHKNRRSYGTMPFEEFTRVIDEMRKWVYKVRFYSWGEPLLHKDIYRMISYTQRNNIGTEVSTNFHSFNNQDPENLIDSGLELLIISLDGTTEKTYGEYRIGGDFRRVVNNIKTLTKAKTVKRSHFPVVEIQFLAMKHNEHEIPDMKKLAKELDVDRLRIAPLTLNVRDPNQVKEWLPSNEKWSRYDYHTLEDKIYRNRRRCEWLWRSTVINWDSTISPCCVFEGPESDFGSLKERSFEKIWNNEHYQVSRNVFNENDNSFTDLKVICQRCKGIPLAEDVQQYGLY